MSHFGRSLSQNLTKEKCFRFREQLRKRRFEIIDILINVETFSMAEDELFRSEDLLSNIDRQSDYLDQNFEKKMSAFLPLNQPLYSYILQVFLPSLVLKQVFYRPPASQIAIYTQLNHIFSYVSDNITLCAVSRRAFLNEFVSQSNILNFTGKYENVLDLINELPVNTSVIYNGSAVNPIVVGNDANIVRAAKDSLEARFYNSGQDCMAPACVFVKKEISQEYIQIVKQELQLIEGYSRKSNISIGKMLETKSIDEFKVFLKLYGENVVYGGEYDHDKMLIYPTVFYFNKWRSDLARIYYSPCLFVIEYQDISEIQDYLNLKFCKRYAGYISLYGESLKIYQWKSSGVQLIQLYNQTLISAENGNEEFGGYGEGCSFVMHNGVIVAKPILILREIHNIFS